MKGWITSAKGKKRPRQEGEKSCLKDKDRTKEQSQGYAAPPLRRYSLSPLKRGRRKQRGDAAKGGLFLAVGQEAFDFVDSAGGDKSRATKAAFALGAFFGQDVAAEGFGATDFSAPGVTKAFFCTARGFEFGHSESPNQEEQEAG